MSPPNTAQIIKLPAAATSKRFDTNNRVRERVEKKVCLLLAGLADNSLEALFEDMRHVSDPEVLRCHFNVMRVIRMDAGVLAEAFCALMVPSWDNLMNGRDLQAVSDAPPDVNDQLRVYSDKILNHYKILLGEVHQRFAWLSLHDVSFHPLLPGNFFLCFWHASASLPLSHRERRILLPLFNRFVMDRFGQVLAIANQTLIEQGVRDGYHSA